MAKTDRKYHSSYQGYDIYFREGIKRRPWSVFHGEGKTPDFTDHGSEIKCKQVIDRLARHDRQRFLDDTLKEYGVTKNDDN